MECIGKLLPEIDAFYVTDHRGQTIGNVERLLEPLLRHHVFTFAQSGPAFVEKGVLFSMTRVAYDQYGLFYARVIAGLFNGQPLRGFSQVFEDPKHLAVNTVTAEIIGYQIPPTILGNADLYPARDSGEGNK